MGVTAPARDTHAAYYICQILRLVGETESRHPDICPIATFGLQRWRPGTTLKTRTATTASISACAATTTAATWIRWLLRILPVGWPSGRGGRRRGSQGVSAARLA